MSLPRLGIDFGSTEIKVLWMSPGGRMKSMETIPVPTNAREKRVTHSPKLFLKRVRSIPDRFEFRGSWEAALASQRSTFILWDPETGDPRIPLISWRDRRGEPWINALSEEQFDRIRSITGLRPEAGYPLSKLCWIFRAQPDLLEAAKKGELLYGSVDTWLLWLGSGGEVFRMDPTQASRTLLYDPQADGWSHELMEEHGIPRSIFPDLVEHFEEPVSMGQIWHNATVISVLGDQPAATIGGQPPPYPQTRVTLGTAGFVAAPCDRENCPPGLTLSFTPTERDRVFQAEGVVLSAGKAAEWLVRVLGIQWKTFELWIKPPWPENLPLWCPSFNGVGAPFWQDRSGTLDLLREDTSTKEICLGLIVSILMRAHDILRELPGDEERRVLMDGGVTTINNVPELASALWDLPTAKTLTPHLTCRGALIASHWIESYFRGDPWETLNVEVTLPTREAPVDHWRNRWMDRLEDWRLTPVR